MLQQTLLTSADFPTPPDPSTTSLYSRMVGNFTRVCGGTASNKQRRLLNGSTFKYIQSNLKPDSNSLHMKTYLASKADSVCNQNLNDEAYARVSAVSEHCLQQENTTDIRRIKRRLSAKKTSSLSHPLPRDCRRRLDKKHQRNAPQLERFWWLCRVATNNKYMPLVKTCYLVNK